MTIVPIAVVGVVALGLTACAGSASAPLTEASLAAQSPGQPVGEGGAASGTLAEGITVVGTGSANAVPDVAEWSFGVQTEAETAEAALRESAQAMRRVLAALRGHGIDRDDLRTSQVSLWPRTRDEGGGVVGYTASSTVSATVRGIARAGAVIDAAVAAGATEVYGPNLRVSDTKAQFDSAVAAAYEDAQVKAAAIAGEAGLSLGSPISIVEGGGGNFGYGERFAALAADAAVPIEPGKQELQVTLTVTFALAA